MKTDVVIVGAGPAGLMLGHLLMQAGIDVVLLERKSADYVLSRIRAGVLEQTTVDVMDQLGLGERMHGEGLAHDGFYLADGDRLIHIDLQGLTGHGVMVYGQTEVTRDLMDAAGSRGLEIVYEAEDVALHDLDSEHPAVTYRAGGETHRLDARFIAGCDGFHGVSRQSVPDAAGKTFERVYPFGWLGILADVPPCNDELIYANHENGFALASMRSRTRSRYYIQVALDDRPENWPEERLWDELDLRLGPEAAARITRGPALEKSIAPLRSFVFEPMRYGSLFLAGDAAHIVPPTGAKGLNLASSDVAYLSRALIAWFKQNDAAGVEAYSSTALARVWKSERFSWTLTNLMHRFPDSGPFGRKMQLAELDYIASSRAAQTTIAENYIGLPL
ncbi:4-hydroxybenzoate 3-monooxygenase [Marinicauda pacifica]|uniref:4-hydroxybenzoate 3-monooxygenase n=1 Tax=Marinicauda pacifica TaxID=1133559 RepID=A0A4S2HEZ2_9PROT|nr:4-hydroxybenzoate 3-monooxygenase [Marinicauda pacifica]TGY94644.1 4-hydroxybenzoate 3-monooxygenase [Marinicauda pacifica]GGE37590.1 4-hydroxybenzoate 3-monooxygenase [Marinicauda pacifica]